jgi:AraC-like DNA-binding protein
VIHEERDIPRELASTVTRVWFLETPPARRYEKILPMPLAHVIINLSEPYRMFDGEGAAIDVADVFASGLQSTYLVIESPPLIRHIGIELAPSGLHVLAPRAAGTTAGRVQDARAVLPGLDGLVSRVRASRAPADALDLVVEHLLAIRVDDRDPLVDAALEAIQSDPDTRIGPLATDLGVSHRALLARFRVVTGTTLKSYAQVLRFHRFIDAVHEAGGPPDWAALAAAAGYYDQPDVIRAFRRFSGWTPTEYYRLAAEHGPDAAHFVPLDQVPARIR